MKKAIQIFVLLLATTLLYSCNGYNKLLKSTDLDKKYEIAKKLYDEKNYSRAFPFFDELLSVYKGKTQAPDVYYYYTYCQYHFGDYMLAAHHFDNFYKTFRSDPRSEEFLYMSAYCHYKDSPRSNLDQSNTFKAIKKLQFFIEKYPNSSRVTEANGLIDELRLKLEVKNYNMAKSYFGRDEYKASIQALSVYLKEYPASKYTEEASFLHLKSHYLLALYSIEDKKAERLQNTIETYYTFVDKFGSSSYIKEAEKFFENTKKEQEKFTLNTNQ